MMADEKQPTSDYEVGHGKPPETPADGRNRESPARRTSPPFSTSPSR
jgi:hypothetical protein